MASDDATRRQHADQAFAEYDMGDLVVKDVGAWNDLGDDEWNRPFYVENGDEPSLTRLFVIRFLPEANKVREGYIAG